jgi:hypothetical protein
MLCQSELQAGACARTAFALADVLETIRDFKVAAEIRAFGESQISQIPVLRPKIPQKTQRRLLINSYYFVIAKVFS